MEKRIRQALSDRFDANTSEKATLVNLGGHASLRIYWRIQLANPTRIHRDDSTLIAMVLPQDSSALKSEEGPDDAPEVEELPFVSVHRYLARLGVTVPTIDHVDMDLGVLLLEDLGDATFEKVVLRAEDRVALYREALDVLIGFQSVVLDDGQKDCICWNKSFDRELLRWELDHYREWGLEAQYDDAILDPHREVLDASFDRIVDALLELPTTLGLRDYQSRNIMLKNGRWYLIDFQDALISPFIYDVVALLRDSYIVLDDTEVKTLVDYYRSAGSQAGLPWCQSTNVQRAFDLQTVQRKLKDAGRFIYIDRVKGNPDFLGYYDSSIGYVRSALERLDDFDDLEQLLSEIEEAF